MSRLIYGVGINDADYNVFQYEDSAERKHKIVWRCPFYVKWQDMLKRCYNSGYQKTQSTYIGCSVTTEWHYFMTFRAWMEKQDWKEKQLDKDILLPGNKVYGPDTCVFVDRSVNSFLLECTASRGEWPIGVYYDSHNGKFRAACSNVQTKKQERLGYFNTAEEAHQAWLNFKLEQAKILASIQTDQRVAKALIDRYSNYLPL